MSDKSNTALQIATFDPFAGPALLLTAPATGPQREIWTATRVSDDASRAFNESVSLRLVGPVDLEALMRATVALVNRHESLRSTFTPDGMTLCVAESTERAVPFIDCRFMADGQREATWRGVLDRAVDEVFDLEQGPLVRVVIVRFAAQEYRVCLTAHHIVCDGWSTAVLVKDWVRLYSAAVNGSEPALPATDAFSAYAFQEVERERMAQHSLDENYWVGQFPDDAPVLDLPTDRPRPALKTYNSRREDLVLDAGLVARLKHGGVKQRTSLFVLLLAGFHALVHRLSGQEDLVVGIPVAGQPADGHFDLVGHCVHLLPIRAQMTGRTSFRELLATMRGRVLDAVEHQAFTFSRLLERLPLRRDPGRPPLVSIIFNLDKGIGPGELQFDGLEAMLSTNPRHFENFELFVNAVELDGRVMLECQYNTDLFDAATVRGWLGAYRQLLVSVAETVDQEIGALSILPDDDRQLLDIWNSTAAPFPPVCVHELIEGQAQRTPDRVALEFAGARITYRELNDRADRLARRLRALGVQRDVLVGLCVDRSIEMVVSVLAVLKAGGGYVPLDPGYPLDRLNFMVSDSRMSVLITTRALRETAPLSAADVLVLEEVEAEEGPTAGPGLSPATPESVAYVIYTSGSTGRPKGVMVPHRAVVNLLASVRDSPGMTDSDVVLAITTLSFDIAVSEILLPLTVGARIVMASRETASDGPSLLKLLRSAGITFVDATPSTWRMLIDAGWQGGERLTAICTGEAMPRDLAIELVARAGTVWNGYGPTETTVWSSFQQVTAPVERILIGRPVANTQLHVLDDRLQPVPIGARGELYIGGAGVTLGYLHRPDLTSERFVRVRVGGTDTTLYRTGDVARYLRTGELECLGRNDDQVKLRGFRIELGEIEDALAGHEALGRVAVVAREDRPGDKRLVGYIVLRPGASATDSELKASLRQSLPGHMIPGVFVRLQTMPLTPSGKVNRRNLPAPEPLAPGSDEAFVAPRTATETIVAELWQQALGIARVSVHDDFFALGGHSLLASQVLARLRRDHGIEILFRKLFEAPTVAQFAALVDARRATAAPVARGISRRPGGSARPLSVMQHRLWMLEMMDPSQRVVHNLPAAWRLTGDLDADLVERSINEIVARHEVLRSCIRVEDGVPRQEVIAEARVALRRVDLRGRPEADREREMMAIFDEDARVPFDVSIAPLMRTTLVRLDEQAHGLFVLPHNLVWDGWSFDIFLDELEVVYEALATGAAPALEPLPIAYGDFASWQKEWLESGDSKPQREWWQQQLAGDLPVLELPLDHERTAQQSRAGANIEVHLGRKDVDELTALARESGGTLFTVLFAAFCLLLHKTSGQAGLLVGTPLRARTRPETEALIGPFMNMLVLRSDIEPQMTFMEFLRRIRESSLDSFSHQEMPLEVVDVRAPILRAFFSLQDARTRPSGFCGLQVSQLHVLPPMAAADVMLWAMETNNGLMAMLNYSTELFDAATMQRFLERYRHVISEIVRDPRRTVKDLPVMPAAEAALLGQFSAPGGPAETFASVYTRFHDQAERAPQALAVTGPADERLSYRDLDQRAMVLAATLRAGGVQCGEPVGILLDRSVDLVTALLACSIAGATAVMMDPDESADRIAAVAEAAGVQICVSAEEYRDLAAWPSPLVVLVSPGVVGGLTAASPEPTPPATPACLFYENDSARGFHAQSITASALSTTVVASARELGLGASDVVLSLAPPSLNVILIELLAPLTAGASVTLAPRDVAADAEQVARLIVTCNASVAIAPVSLWRQLVAADFSHPDRLRAVCIGGRPREELTQELIARTRQAWVADHFAGSAIWTTLHRLTAADTEGVVGRPLPGQHVAIRGGILGEALLGSAGPLWLGEPGCDSGAVARWRADGTLQLIGSREDEVFLDGFRIDTTAVARALAAHPALAEAAVVLRDDDLGDPRLAAYIVVRPGENATLTELRSLLRRTLPARMIPRAFIEVASLREIPAADGRRGAASGAGECVEPRTATEQVLARLWKDALHIDRVSLHDNFFSLGGYSLLCFQVLERVHRETGQRLSPRILLLDTLQQVAAQLDRSSHAVSSS